VARAAEAAGAEEATRTAEAAEAQARAERRARRLTAAQAASVLALVGLGGAGGIWLQHQRAERAAAVARSVEYALAEAMRREGEARAAAADDPTRWAAALAEAHRADDLLRQGEADDSLRRRVASVLATLTLRRDEAARRAALAAADRRLLAALDAARSGNHDLPSIDARYAAAFRAAGLDVDRLPPEEAGAWIASRSAPVELVAYLDDWSHVRRDIDSEGKERPWAKLSAAALRADPDPWRGRLRAGVAGDAATLRSLAQDERTLEGQPAMSLNLLGVYLRDVAREPELAERVWQLAWRLYPTDYWINHQLASRPAPGGQESPERLRRWQDDRLRFATAVVVARPHAAVAFALVGEALADRGRGGEAIAAYRRAVRLDPGFVPAREGLADLLIREGDSNEAATARDDLIAELREAIRLDPRDARAHLQLGLALRRRGEADAGIAAMREAVRLDGSAVTHFILAGELERRREDDQAEAAYREAARLDGEHVGEAIFHLGALLRRLGRYDEAAAIFLQVHTLAEAEGQPEQALRAERERELTERRKALEGRLPAMLRGADRPHDRDELLEIGRLCRDRRYYAAAARLFESALRENPVFDGNGVSPHRYDAACLAALAGCATGADDPQPDEAERTRFRGLALRWLESELAAISRYLDADKTRNREAVSGWLGHWQGTPDLAGVRSPDALKKLPGHEREGWRALWGEWDALRAKARGREP
jgi:tetratricopeptide (TPR) repeat protein